MALTYQQSADLMADVAFKDRVKVCCLNYAGNIMNEAANVAAHQTRIKWSQRTFTNPESVAMEVISPTVMDAAVQTDGAAISDAALQTAVETTVNKML